MEEVRAHETQTVNWLAVECAGAGLLFSLKQAGEIFKPGTIKPLPYAKPWLVGVANLRGGLFTVVDLAVFLGLREAGRLSVERRGDAAQARLVSLNPDLNINCALLVDSLVGLRGDDQLTLLPVEPGARPRFAGPRRMDREGRLWQQLDLDALSRHEQFLQLVA